MAESPWVRAKDLKRGLINIVDTSHSFLYDNGKRYELRSTPDHASTYAAISFLSDRVIKLSDCFTVCATQLDKLNAFTEKLNNFEKELEKLVEIVDKIDDSKKKAEEALERSKALEQNLRCLRSAVEEMK